MDVFHTGSYIRSHYNFRISGLKEKAAGPPIAETLLNVYFRGTPSPPSHLLKQRLSEIGIEHSNQPSIHIDSDYQPDWGKSILGSDNGLNPALSFYQDTLKKSLGEYSLLYSLFRPETKITDILTTKEGKKFKNERVDFFLPVANLIIEIDGSQHQTPTQSQRDRERDQLFNRHDIKTIRIKTTHLQNKGEMESISLDIRRHLSQSDLVKAYTKLARNKDQLSNIAFITAFRLQITIIEMLSRGMISLDDKEWTLNIRSEADEKVTRFAIDDLMNWVSLLDKTQDLPFITLTDDPSALTIDISISRRWDDEIFDNNIISCRSDHFDYFPQSQTPGSTGKDYFYSSPSLKDNDYTNSNLSGLLKEIYGYDNFNPGQIDIIENVIAREDTIGILPTGGGKSLCYQLPGILHSGLTLVVCPIKSLMRDQVRELIQIGVHRAHSIDSDTSTDEKEAILAKVRSGKSRFLFVSPERLQISTFRDSIKALHDAKLINLVVIDEVHCMSEWGHDFRTSYLTLAKTLSSIAARVPRLCLTATASKKVLDDIKSEFSIGNDNVKTLSHYERKNLIFRVIECDPLNRTINLVKERVDNHLIDSDKAAIIFSPFVDGSDGAFNLYQSIKEFNAQTGIFTGKKPKLLPTSNYDSDKAKTQDNFKDSNLSILVATKAFGMGVNKKNVCTTIHSCLPTSVESLYQEAGRAGRNKQLSDCFLLYKKPSNAAFRNFFDYRSFQSFIASKPKADSGDLRIHHFFLKNTITQNYKVPDTAIRILSHLITTDGESSEVSSSVMKSDPDTTQLALYRLSQMDVIQDWTIEDFNRGIYLVDFKISPISHHNSVVQKLTGKSLPKSEISSVVTMDDWLSAMSSLTSILINYHLDTRVHSRIESLKTLLYACDTYDPQNPDAFREEIESYFIIDAVNNSISDIITSNGRQDSVITYLSGPETQPPILHQDIHSIQKRLFPLRRYIESYPDDSALSLINELFLLHIRNDYNFLELTNALTQYLGNDLGESDGFDFIKSLSPLLSKEARHKFEQSIYDHIHETKGKDRLARALDNDQLTENVVSLIITDLQELAGKLNESI